MGIWAPGPAATAGADTYTGDVASDTADGLGGDDTLLGLGGNDNLVGGEGADTLRGGEGGDLLEGGAGDDLLEGGGHGIGNRDTATYASAPAGVVVDLRIAGAQNTIGAGLDTLVGIDALTGSSFSDTFNGADAGEFFFDQFGGADQFFGNGGDDNLSVSRQLTGDAVVLDGGEGFDSLSFSGRTTLAGPNPTATIRGGEGDDFISVRERTGLVDVDGGVGSDLFSLNTLAIAGVIVFDGSNADAATATRDGAPVLSMRRVEAYTIQTGTGADSLTGGGGGDTLAAATGDDLLRGLGGDDTLAGGTGVNRLEGGDGNDTARYADAGSGVTVNLLLQEQAQATGVSSDTLSGIENLSGSTSADRLTGDGVANALSGGAGDDTLHGFTGDDTLTGGAGADNLYGGDGADTFVVTTAADSTLTVYDNIVDFTAGDRLDLTAITGAGSTVTVQQRFGCAFVYIDRDGNGTFDAEIIGQGLGLSVSGLVTGAAGYRFTVYGSTEAGDTLSGGANADVLAGFEGTDVLVGGGGSDLLYGGAGADTFRYLSIGDSNLSAYDYIQDFEVGTDKLDLRALNTSGASTYLLSQFGGSTFIYVDQNGDNAADFVVIASGVTLTAADVQWTSAAPSDGWVI